MQGVEAARGRTNVLVVSASTIPIIMAVMATFASLPSLWGHRAMVLRVRRRRAALFGGPLVYNVHVFGREESPSAAPTQQKRGPRRPHRTGRRGRLPFWLAYPCRGFHIYPFRYKEILDKLLAFSRIRTGKELITLVVAFSGGSAASEGRAMVAGMAMADLASRALNICNADSLPHCAAIPSAVGGSTQGNQGEDMFFGIMLRLFTPLHTLGPRVSSMLFDMIVWGATPLWLLVTRERACNLALTPAAPRRCDRA